MAPTTLPKSVIDAQSKGITVLELTGDNEEKYYFQKPGTADINRFIATATKGKAAQAARNLVIEMAIAPTSEELSAEFQAQPGRMVALNSALQGAVGMNEDFATKKL
ncbi:MAG: hypothetical protein PHC49_10545 [Desulfuromonadaceae bacterium]|nr:hypothetical protein [Desulfuromonadaceae bacterium]